MLAKFVEKITSMSYHQVEKDGRLLVNWAMSPIKEAEPACLTVHTLDGVIDYMNMISADSLPEMIAHVEEHDTVWLRSRLYGTEKQRDTFILAKAHEIKHKFGENLPLDTFLTYIQVGFVQDENTALLLRALGNIVDENSVGYTDDGVTQQVVSRKGITRREVVSIPTPITLRPYRTFPDIEQPEGMFVLRLKKQGSVIMGALHEADGGAWKREAVANIKIWFGVKRMEHDLTNLTVIG